jgi:uncharacterized protein (TIGR03067 family)
MNLPRVLGYCFTVALLPAATIAGDAKDDAIKKERKRFEGTWLVETLEFNGIPFSEEQAKAFKIINEADGKWSIEQDGKVVASGTSVVDPSMSPKTVDLTQTEGSGSGQVLQGIYEFTDDNTRKVCFAAPGKARPTEFSSAAGSQTILAVLKKVKKK